MGSVLQVVTKSHHGLQFIVNGICKFVLKVPGNGTKEASGIRFYQTGYYGGVAEAESGQNRIGFAHKVATTVLNSFVIQ